MKGGGKTEIVKLNVKPEELAINVWLSLVDELLERRVPMSNAMLFAGQRLQEKQKEHNGGLFHPYDLINATEAVNILLKRRPEYIERTKGWSKSSIESKKIDH